MQPEFNPRTSRDAKRFAQLVCSVCEDGVLQPLLVTPEPDGEFRVIAGEGRYLAAGEAGVVEVPVLVRDVDERTAGLELALAENLPGGPRSRPGGPRLPPAQGGGYTKKGIADRLGVSQKLVGDRLAILDIPAELHPGIADGSIAPSAIKALVGLGRIHPGLPGVVAARVAAPPARQWDERLSWAQVVEDPIAALVADYEGDDVGLPADVFDAGESYPIGRFSLSGTATRDLGALGKLLASSPSSSRCASAARRSSTPWRSRRRTPVRGAGTTSSWARTWANPARRDPPRPRPHPGRRGQGRRRRGHRVVLGAQRGGGQGAAPPRA